MTMTGFDLAEATDELTAVVAAGRKPCRWATYAGDCRGNRGLVVGPNTFGELLHIVTEDYDPVTDKTRVGFAYGPPLTSGPAAAGGPLQDRNPHPK